MHIKDGFLTRVNAHFSLDTGETEWYNVTFCSWVVEK